MSDTRLIQSSPARASSVQGEPPAVDASGQASGASPNRVFGWLLGSGLTVLVLLLAWILVHAASNVEVVP